MFYEYGNGSNTLFGSLKEFSSIRLLEVKTVLVDPESFAEFDSNPSTETLRYTVLLPKFTI